MGNLFLTFEIFIAMFTLQCRVVGKTEPVNLTKKNGEPLAKCFIRLKAIGGDYTDEFYGALLGNRALVDYQPGEVVDAVLSFKVFEANGNLYQDVSINEIVKR